MRSLTRHIEGLTLTQGEGAGGPFPLLHWERRFLAGAFKPEVDEAGLSIARGNGKTTLCSAIAHACLDGPLVQPRAEVAIVASSFDQGKIAGDHTLAMIEDAGDRKKWRIWDTSNRFQIRNRINGVTLKCLGSDPKRAHGLAPSLVLADEPAQWPHTTADQMISTLRTALGKIPGSRLIALGTKAEHDDHWFSELLANDADFAMSFTAARELPPFQKRTWIRANPSLPHMPKLERTIRKEAQKARRNPKLLQSFRAMRLNQGTSDVIKAYLVEPEEWQGIESTVPERVGRYVLGLDLGTTRAMCGAFAFWPETGWAEALAVFPQNPDLRERGLADGVGRLYIQMHERGELHLSGLYTANIGGLLDECLERWGRPLVMVCDRWREGDLKEACAEIKFPITKIITRGQGYKDGSEDVRAFQRAVADGDLKPEVSLLMRAALKEARLASDPAGNQKLSKSGQGGRRARARDDAAAASIIAVAEGMRRKKRKPKGKRRVVMVA